MLPVTAPDADGQLKRRSPEIKLLLGFRAMLCYSHSPNEIHF